MDAPIKVFTASEKKNLLWRVSFRGLNLNHVDFSDADLRCVLFDDTNLRGCDFTGADLRGAIFLCCDLAQTRLDRAILFGTRFPGSSLAGSSGLTREQVEYVLEHGGIFVTQASSDMQALPGARASQ
jgi:uncharacterized protein YjbI with pentapeptide repeats